MPHSFSLHVGSQYWLQVRQTAASLRLRWRLATLCPSATRVRVAAQGRMGSWRWRTYPWIPDGLVGGPSVPQEAALVAFKILFSASCRGVLPRIETDMLTGHHLLDPCRVAQAAEGRQVPSQQRQRTIPVGRSPWQSLERLLLASLRTQWHQRILRCVGV